MVEFGGILYFIDLDAFDAVISMELLDSKLVETHSKTILDENGKVTSVEINEHSSERVKEISPAKYDIIRTMLDVVLDVTEDDIDDTLGAERGLEKTSLSFKIAFNTLIEYGILKEK